MKNKELQEILKKYPDEMNVMLYRDSTHLNTRHTKDFDKENICDHAFDDRVSEKGNLIKDKGERVLMINPPIY